MPQHVISVSLQSRKVLHSLSVFLNLQNRQDYD